MIHLELIKENCLPDHPVDCLDDAATGCRSRPGVLLLRLLCRMVFTVRAVIWTSVSVEKVAPIGGFNSLLHTRDFLLRQKIEVTSPFPRRQVAVVLQAKSDE